MSYPPIFTSDGITVDVNTYEEIKPVDFVKNWIYIYGLIHGQMKQCV